MAVILEGPYTYEEQYVIEHEDAIYGPFAGAVQATAFAFERFEFPWTIRVTLHPKRTQGETK